jgi:hypothetical protein
MGDLFLVVDGISATMATNKGGNTKDQNALRSKYLIKLERCENRPWPDPV